MSASNAVDSLPSGNIGHVPSPTKADESAKSERIVRLREAMLGAGYETGKKSAGDKKKPQSALAEAAGIRSGTITRLLNGERAGDFPTYEKLAKALDVHAEWLWSGRPPKRAGVALQEDPPMKTFVGWYLDQPTLHMACTKGNYPVSTVLKAWASPLYKAEYRTVEQWDEHLKRIEDAANISELEHGSDVEGALTHIKKTRGR